MLEIPRLLSSESPNWPLFSTHTRKFILYLLYQTSIDIECETGSTALVQDSLYNFTTSCGICIYLLLYKNGEVMITRLGVCSCMMAIC